MSTKTFRDRRFVAGSGRMEKVENLEKCRKRWSTNGKQCVRIKLRSGQVQFRK
jgi:hypothetical protein